jgi:hypothetical protein
MKRREYKKTMERQNQNAARQEANHNFFVLVWSRYLVSMTYCETTLQGRDLDFARMCQMSASLLVDSAEQALRSYN